MVPLEDNTFNLPPFKGLHSARKCFYGDFTQMGMDKMGIKRVLAQDFFRRQFECLSNVPGLEVSEETVRELRALAYQGTDLRILVQDAFRHQLACLSKMPGLEVSEETVRELRTLAYQGTDLRYHKH